MGRTMAVVLFTDLVGSTELRARLGEEAADELRRKHDQVLAQAVEANNGSVVKGLGDGIMATFAGASGAVAAAVAIQQAIDRLNRTGKAPVPLSVRVGLSAGDVAFEDDDVHGTPVIEAARLCAAAAGGDILAAEVVRVLAGATAEHAYVAIGPLELKGLDHLVAAVRVGWEPAVVSSIPMPQLLTDVGRIFVGRDSELERLDQLWKEAAAGERRIALLAGEPGVGKTRLAAELAIRIHEDGGIVLAGRCDEDLGVPYQPFVETLRHFVDHSQPAELTGRLGRYGGELTRLVPELAEQVPDLPQPLQSDPETERYRLFDAVAGWLSAAAAEEPVLLVLDDLQWAAKPTLLLLRHVVRASDARRLLILGTYRDTELTHDHPLVELVADLRRGSAVERLPLSGLDDVAVTAIVEQAAGQALDEEGVALARAIYQETEGNPFFVREVLRHLTETKAIERQHGGWRTRVPIDQLGIPEGVRDVVGRRLARLSEEANQVLRVAAVIGAEFELTLVQTAGQLAESDVLAALDEGIRARLVSEVSPTRFQFAHALVRATLYESLTGARRVALHRRAAEAIESLREEPLDDYLPALAHHWARGSVPADTGRAVEYARRAGDQALAQLAHDEAAAYYREALELLDAAGSRDDHPRCQLLIRLGEAERRAGNAEFRETFLSAGRLAERLGDTESLAAVALGNYRGLWSGLGQVDRDRVTILEQALHAQPAGATQVRARLLANLAVEVTYQADNRRFELSDEAVALARDLQDPATLAHVLLARSVAIWSPDTVTQRLEATEELLNVSKQLDDPTVTCQGLLFRWLAATDVGDRAEADRCLGQGESLLAEVAQPLIRWIAGIFRSNSELSRGRIEASDSVAEEALRLAELAGQSDARVYYLTRLFVARLDQARVGEIADDIVGIATANPQVMSLSALDALLRSELGDDDQARPLLQRLVTRFLESPREGTWLVAGARMAMTCINLGDRVHAPILYDGLVPYRRLMANTGSNFFGAVAHHLGALAATIGRFDDAERHFAAAEVAQLRFAAPAWVARTRLEWARLLFTRREASDSDRARELLGQALATARELSLAQIERRAAALLAECP